MALKEKICQSVYHNTKLVHVFPAKICILKLADALHCNYKSISDYSLGAAEDIIETLFWLEESAASLPARGKGTRFQSTLLLAI